MNKKTKMLNLKLLINNKFSKIIWKISCLILVVRPLHYSYSKESII